MMGYVYHFFGSEYLTPGSNISYDIRVDGKTFASTIKAPEAPVLNCPNFDPESDYSFTWTLSEDPNKQILSYGFMGSDDNKTGYKELSASRRSYTIPKTDWQNLGNLTFAFLKVMATNFKTHTNCYVSASYDAGHHIIGIGKRDASPQSQALKFHRQFLQAR